MGAKRSLEERFWAKVQKTLDPDACWEWTGAKSVRREYGMIKGENWRAAPLHAHRVSYELHYGDIPEGLEIDHVCENKSCVNPIHLQAVTHRENMHASYE